MCCVLLNVLRLACCVLSYALCIERKNIKNTRRAVTKFRQFRAFRGLTSKFQTLNSKFTSCSFSRHGRTLGKLGSAHLAYSKFTSCSFSRHGRTQASLVLLIWLTKMFLTPGKGKDFCGSANTGGRNTGLRPKVGSHCGKPTLLIVGFCASGRELIRSGL